jgi:hypothetical protein
MHLMHVPDLIRNTLSSLPCNMFIRLNVTCMYIMYLYMYVYFIITLTLIDIVLGWLCVPYSIIHDMNHVLYKHRV